MSVIGWQKLLQGKKQNRQKYHWKNEEKHREILHEEIEGKINRR